MGYISSYRPQIVMQSSVNRPRPWLSVTLKRPPRMKFHHVAATQNASCHATLPSVRSPPPSLLLSRQLTFHFSESHRHAKSMCSSIYCYKATSLGPGSFSSIKLNQTVNMAQAEIYNALDDIELDVIRDTTPGVNPLNRYCIRPGTTVGPLTFLANFVGHPLLL